MKTNFKNRIISLISVMALLASFLVFPVSAESLDEASGWYNVLDYTYVNGDSNKFTFIGNTTIGLDLPEYGKLYYIDFIIAYTGAEMAASVVASNSKQYSLNCVNIDNNYYRYFGYINYHSYETLYISFIGDPERYYSCELHTCYVSTINTDSFSDFGTVLLRSGTASSVSVMSYPGETISVAISDDETIATFYQAAVYTDNWAKYDYIDFYLNIRASSITSVMAHQAGIGLNVDYSLIEGSYDIETGTNMYTVVVRLDLTGVDRNATDIPYVEFDGVAGVITEYKLYNVMGHITVESVNPLLYFTTHLENTIQDCFEFLNGWLNVYFEGIVNELSAIKNSINLGFESLKGWLNSGFQSVVDKLDEFVNGSAEQQAAAEDFKNNASNQAGQLDQAVSDMQVSRPAAGSIDTSIGSMTGNLDFGLLNSCVQSLVQSNTVYQCLIMAVTLMLVSYLLFGKKV